MKPKKINSSRKHQETDCLLAKSENEITYKMSHGEFKIIEKWAGERPILQFIPDPLKEEMFLKYFKRKIRRKDILQMYVEMFCKIDTTEREWKKIDKRTGKVKTKPITPGLYNAFVIFMLEARGLFLTFYYEVIKGKDNSLF